MATWKRRSRARRPKAWTRRGSPIPTAAFVDIYIAEVDVPIIGRNLLGEANWRKLMGQLDGAPAMLVLSSGRWTFMPEISCRDRRPT